MPTKIPNIEELAAVFDRRHVSHPWLRAFDEQESRGPQWRAVIANWRIDHRVSVEREKELLGAPGFGDCATGDDWEAATLQHFDRALCLPAAPPLGGARSQYVESCNASNSIPRDKVPPHEQLVHVAALDRLLERIDQIGPSTAVKTRFFELAGRPFPARHKVGRDRSVFQKQVRETVETVNGKGLAHVQELAVLLCDALGPNEPPWWACLAQEAAPFFQAADWPGLTRALGLGHLLEGSWLLIWRYQVGSLPPERDAASFVRPTVVETRHNPYHFPSPPGYTWGICMPLARHQRGALREVLHRPLKGEVAGQACSWLAVRLEEPPIASDNEILELRRAHRRRLSREFPASDTNPWLLRHSTLP